MVLKLEGLGVRKEITKAQDALENFVLKKKTKAKWKKMTIILLKGRFFRLVADKPVRHLDAD